MITSSSRTRSNVARSIGPCSGLRPPSPRRYRVDRSASLTATRGSAWARPRKSAASSAGTVRLTGSLSPPCGGIRSGMDGSPSDLVGKGTVFLGAADQVGEGHRLEEAPLLGLGFFPDAAQGPE